MTSFVKATLRFDKPGTYALNLRPVSVNNALGLGPKVESITLRKL